MTLTRILPCTALAALTSVSAAFAADSLVLGQPTGPNLTIDPSAVSARDNGVASTLSLNPEGGHVLISAAGGGNVGIGEPNPGARLEIRDNQFGWGIELHQDGPGGGIYVDVTDTSALMSALSLTGASSNVPTAVISHTDPAGTALRVDGVATVKVLEIQGADLAEKFPVSEPLAPGQVVEIDPANPGKLRLSRQAYNRRVVGVVSGANGLSAGAVLGAAAPGEVGPPIALSGRVWVLCDAAANGIEVGDLLTTADSPGRAMKAVDHARAQGAVIGKAMTSLASGLGRVLVLVSLQ
ncbi:MAG: hypothetical protein ACE5GX_06495 [Thermoanaerobaculia bacterium]